MYTLPKRKINFNDIEAILEVINKINYIMTDLLKNRMQFGLYILTKIEWNLPQQSKHDFDAILWITRKTSYADFKNGFLNG